MCRMIANQRNTKVSNDKTDTSVIVIDDKQDNSNTERDIWVRRHNITLKSEDRENIFVGQTFK